MPLRISFARYRLLFKHPFETSHGVRDGTDSVFIRVEEDGHVGHGEVTLPPYLAEKPEEVVDRITGAQVAGLGSSAELLAYLNDPAAWVGYVQGYRAGLQMAWVDLIGKKTQQAANQILGIVHLKQPVTLVTIGITPLDQVAKVLRELPESDALKVKLNGPRSMALLQAVLNADTRQVFLDANQGLNNLAEAELLAQAAGERLLAMEQPFSLAMNGMQRSFQVQMEVCVYGDEAIQGLKDLEHTQGEFKGVNIKLMKCGGLDRAKAMADRADQLGMKVMLGSMSESSLGCTAMAHLAGQADVIDLDGPWLIKNDPFRGIGMRQGKLVMPEKPGIGAVPIKDLEYRPVCA